MKKWRCTVCGYIHEGDAPPDACPVCGVGPEFFEPVEDEPAKPAPQGGGTGDNTEPVAGTGNPLEDAKQALFKISYGLFIVTAAHDGKVNGQAANTVFQITSDPMRVALGINKHNLTHEFIEKSGALAVTILGQDGHDLVRRFGYRSGREQDKFAGLDYTAGTTGAPIVSGGIAYLEGRVFNSMDVGTHTLYVIDVVAGRVLRDAEPMTYAYFRATK